MWELNYDYCVGRREVYKCWKSQKKVANLNIWKKSINIEIVEKYLEKCWQSDELLRILNIFRINRKMLNDVEKYGKMFKKS